MIQRKEIMTSANQRAKTEGRPEALRAAHKASKGILVASGIVRKTLKQQSRLYSNYTPSSKKEQEEVLTELNVDFAMF